MMASYLALGLAALSTCLAVEPADKLKADENYRAGLRIFQQTKDLKKSEELNDKALAIDPDHLHALMLKGAIAMERRDFAATRATFEWAEKSHPNEPMIRFNLAELDFVAHRWPKAEKEFAALLEADFKSDQVKPLARFKLMVATLKQGDRKAYDTHRAVFKKEGLQMQIDFSELLLEIDTKKPAYEEASRRWLALAEKHEGAAAYTDSLLEAYYQEMAKAG